MGWEEFGGRAIVAQKKTHDHKVGQYSVYTAASLVDLFSWGGVWAKLARPKFPLTHFGERRRKKTILDGGFFLGYSHFGFFSGPPCITGAGNYRYVTLGQIAKSSRLRAEPIIHSMNTTGAYPMKRA